MLIAFSHIEKSVSLVCVCAFIYNLIVGVCVCVSVYIRGVNMCVCVCTFNPSSLGVPRHIAMCQCIDVIK